MRLRVLYEDNHLLAVMKPPGLPTQGAAAGRPSLVGQVREYIRRKYRKPGNVYLGVVARLDAPASGVVVFARTSKAAARLSEQFRSRTVEKTYWALVEGRVEPAAAACVDRIAADEPRQRMVLLSAAGGTGQEARLSYRRLKAGKTRSLLEISLETGRKHQIRVQLAGRGHPVLGDRKYGAKQPFEGGIALHCRRLVIEHPVRRTPVELIAPPPDAWKRVTF